MADPQMSEADKLGLEIMEKSAKLAELRKTEAPVEVSDYSFQTNEGETTLSGLFAGRDKLLVIHNMGQGCRYCTTYADGINGVIDHLEDAMAVTVVSKDPPEIQRRMALDRRWKFRMASHGGGEYMEEQCKMAGYDNCPGAAVYEMQDSKIMRRAQTPFGPGDFFSPVWPFLALAGMGEADWTPQFHYWSRPQKLDDGGENVRD